MFDRETDSLWNQFTGKPVVGPLVGSGIELKQRPVVITSWKRWKTSHANTKVLSVDTGHRRDYGSGVVYSEYFGSNDLMFPADVDQRDHKQKDYVFAVREFGAARAWPVKAFAKRKVINDAIADKPLFCSAMQTHAACAHTNAARIHSNPVSYTHLPSPRDQRGSRMPSSA